MGGQDDRGLPSRKATEMFVVVDPNDAPGLRGVLEESQAGHEFDVVTRSGAGVLTDPDASPVALLSVRFTEADLVIELAVDVDGNRNSLVELVRTRRLTLMDDARSNALLSLPPTDAFKVGTSVSIPIDHVEPVIGLLQQRVDLPLPTYAPLATDLDDENREDALKSFVAGARAPRAVAVQYRDYGKPSVVIVDPKLPSMPEGAGAPLQGRWGALCGSGKIALRLDAFLDGQPFGSWVIPDPGPQVVRAGAAGSHHVMLVREAIGDDQAEAERIWSEGVSIWVEHVEALRGLLSELDVPT